MKTATEPKSKTLVIALDELKKGFEQSESVSISDLPKQLAENLPFNYRVYLPFGKTFETPIKLQKMGNGLYCATYTLVDADEKRGAS